MKLEEMKVEMSQGRKETNKQAIKHSDRGRDGETKREGWREGQKNNLSAELSRAWCACIYEDE